MSDPIRAPDVVLQCEHTGCLAIPDLAPRIYCPAKATGTENHRYPPVTLAFPHLHYCKPHWETDVRLDALLTDQVKARIEERGRKIWPHGVVPDFDAALIEPIGIWTPEYEQYMTRLGFKTDGLGYSMWRDGGRALSR